MNSYTRITEKVGKVGLLFSLGAVMGIALDRYVNNIPLFSQVNKHHRVYSDSYHNPPPSPASQKRKDEDNDSDKELETLNSSENNVE